jgi:nucleotide-binding universal stress UspA family protein
MSSINIKKIGLALAFSPRMEAMMAEATRLLHMFKAELVLVHVGEETVEAKEKVKQLLLQSGVPEMQVKILWKEGDPADCILKACKEERIDLLVAGALKKENFMQYYLGTTARKILRKADCSVLMLVSPSVEKQPFNQIVVNAEDSAYVHDALETACELGLKEKSSWLHVVREVKMYGLTMSALDDRTEEEYTEVRNGLMRTEIENVEKLLAKIPHEGLKVNIKLVSGKSGFELSKFAQRKQADLLVVGASPRKFFLFDRVFTHDHEYLFQDLPCNLLIVNPKSRKEAANG